MLLFDGFWALFFFSEILCLSQEKVYPQKFQEMAGHGADEDWSLTIVVTHSTEPSSLKAWLEREARRQSWGKHSASFNSFSEESQDRFAGRHFSQGTREVPRCTASHEVTFDVSAFLPIRHINGSKLSTLN